MLKRRNIAAVDLFAGAGGLSIGATWAGCEVRGVVELDAVACQTLRLNPEYHSGIFEGDVADIDGKGIRALAGIGARDPLIIMGGAPCQPFSKAAYWTEKGDESRYRQARASGVKAVRPAAPTDARPDQRRDLVYQFARLVVEANPSGFVFENVPSIKHPRNRPVLDAFTNMVQAAGYETVEVTANAAEYGVAQTRERVFVLGTKKRKPKIPAPTHALT
ncbi:MAG: DNA (cytosine-5-)-methyltransferase, partial [Rhizomicrobium sp.]